MNCDCGDKYTCDEHKQLANCPELMTGPEKCAFCIGGHPTSHAHNVRKINGPEERVLSVNDPINTQARVILDSLASREFFGDLIGDKQDVVMIAAHLRSYGEEEYERGRSLGHMETFIEMKKQASADGFRRGVEEAAKKLPKVWARSIRELLLQRGLEGER